MRDSMRTRCFNYVKALMEQRGIDGKISRRELILRGLKVYDPDAYSKKQQSIRTTVDKVLRDLSKTGYLRVIERGKYEINALASSSFTVEYLNELCLNLEKSKAKKSSSKSS